MASRYRSLTSPTLSLFKSTISKPSIKPIHVPSFSVRSSPPISSLRVEMNSRQYGSDSIAASIDMMIRKLHPLSTNCSIHRVPKHLVNVNPKSYTPQLISIGPFHHGHNHFKAMEELKLRFFYSFLRRIKMGIEALIAIGQVRDREWDIRARNCYAEHIDMSSDDFVRMMVIDGCFIVELVIRSFPNRFPPIDPNEYDPLFYEALSIDLYRDLTMLENQLPFFVIHDLFLLYPPIKNHSIPQVIHDFFSVSLIINCNLPREISTTGSQEKVKHLVDFLRFYYFPSVSSVMGDLLLPPTATELVLAGVVLNAATENGIRFMDITFREGSLNIPPLVVDDGFETYLRNLVAFEHYHGAGGDDDYAINYVLFMDGLINTQKDVELLIKAKIIINHMGSDEKVSKLFNELCRDVTIARGKFYFNGTCKELREHCKKQRHRWMASLRRDYFHTPWALISFIAAVFLIILTTLQTVLSAVSLALHQKIDIKTILDALKSYFK